MTVNLFPVDGTNPFAEAAGETADMLGTPASDVAGHIAQQWDKAVRAAQPQDQASLPDVVTSAPVPDVPDIVPVPPLSEMNEAPAPMGAQWDRLSMTVASLVAWNLTNDVAPDSVEDLASSSMLPSGMAAPLTVEPDTLATPPGEVPVTEADLGAVDAALSAQASTVQVTATTTSPEPEVPLSATTTAVTSTRDHAAQPIARPMNRDETISSRIAGQTGLNTDDNGSIREGKVTAPKGVSSAQPSTESGSTIEHTDGRTWAGTTAGAEAHNSSYEPQVSTGPEIPPTLAAAAAQVSGTPVADPSAPVDTAPRPTPKPSVSSGPSVDVAQPTVMAEQGRAQSRPPTAVGPASQQPEVDVDAQQSLAKAKASADSSVAAKEAASSSVAQSEIDALRRRAAANQTRKLPQAPVVNPSASAESSSTTEAAKPSAPVSDPATTPEFLKAARPMSAELHRPARSQPSATLEAPLPSVDTGAGAASIHQPISEMEREFSVTESILDAEQIGAEEVPELPISDTTHFDIDIDDPGGQVRLDLTRQADEVAVRLETPEEILEEYRDLERDIEEALEQAGMSLTDFEATADGEADERSDRDSRERTSSGPQDGDGQPEEAPKRGRLLNRIV